MVTLTTINNALKEIYLGVLADNLNNTTDSLLTKIKRTSSDVYGKEILVPIEVNGKCITLRSELVNMYAQIEISDKAIRASQNSINAVVSLVNSECECLLRETQRKIIRAFYTQDTKPFWVNEKQHYEPLKLNGLKHLFTSKSEKLYGVDRQLIAPIEKHIDRFNYIKIQEIIDENNDEVNAIVCSSANKRLYQQYLLDHNQPIEYIECFGLKNLLKFNNNYMMFYNNDLPDNEIYLINTNDFRFHELCDWQWISDENDNVLKQVERKPVYRATLVKYGNYMCHKPHRQIKVTIGENND